MLIDIKEYQAQEPWGLLRNWYEVAQTMGEKEGGYPDKAVLATCNQQSMLPQARVVLVKTIDKQHGAIFFTNYASAKAADLASNPNACLLFYWPSLQVQIRFSGVTHKCTEKISADYFAKRPRASQLASIASKQSQPMNEISDYEDELAQLQMLHADCESLDLPENWGGYHLHPMQIEFWQEGKFRMHQRLFFITQNEGVASGAVESWQHKWLYP